MPIGQLAQVLRGVSGEKDERVLVGPETFDDAGVVELGNVEGLSAGTNVALVQTVDYFPPVVDDPWFYGAIAAANALSDVYAMGGKPFSALNLAGIPKDFSPEWTAEIFRDGPVDRIVAETVTVHSGGKLDVAVAANGGFTVRLRPHATSSPGEDR